LGSPSPRRSWHDEEGDELGEEAGESNPFTELGAAFKKRGSEVPELLRQVTVVLALVPRAGLAFAENMMLYVHMLIARDVGYMFQVLSKNGRAC
jgi:hypothetical protein